MKKQQETISLTPLQKLNGEYMIQQSIFHSSIDNKKRNEARKEMKILKKQIKKLKEEK